jgi:hypothetical protein
MPGEMVCLVVIGDQNSSTMSDKYSTEILIKLLLTRSVLIWLLVGHAAKLAATSNLNYDEPYQTITRRSSYGVEHIEHAFHAPLKGLPNHVLELFCSSVRLRLYWNGYRKEIKATHRKGVYLRRMARLAKHLFEEIRDVDKPFNATMLSKVDKHFAAKFDQSRETTDEDDFEFDDDHQVKHKPFSGFKSKFSKKLNNFMPKFNDENNLDEIVEEIDSSETAKELNNEGKKSTLEKIKKFAKSWNFKKATLFIYTRWRTMWWMALSCLYTKYYLWDPALDEFIKLKRSLLMWPDLQLVKLKDLQCKPLVFFRRIMDICKMLNPLMRIDFWQFNYNSRTIFKEN